MPLFLEFYDEKFVDFGKFIVDRNIITIGYPRFSPDAFKNIRTIAEVVEKCSYYKEHRLEKSFDAEDPKHLSEEHLSSYDKIHLAHYHFIFKTDINYEIVKEMLHHLFSYKFNHFDIIPVSDKCIYENLDIAANYFDELDKNPGAVKIEQEYRDDKQLEFKKITKSLNEYSLFPVEDTKQEIPAGALVFTVFGR
ncbi:MAG: hypothetical protein H0U57_03500 [Tatlockia sp.]|nr:hypothetical protein [Tatlockia sp.]